MSGYSTAARTTRSSAGAGYTYTYDNEGNLLTGRTQTSSGNVWTYTWDYRNRLTGVVEKNSSGTVLMQGTYTYDPLDRRIGSVDETVGGHRRRRLWTVYNGTNPVRRLQRVRHAPGCAVPLTARFGTDEYPCKDLTAAGTVVLGP